MQQLFRGVKSRRQPHRLAELIKEIHEEQIRQVRQKILLRQFAFSFRALLYHKTPLFSRLVLLSNQEYAMGRKSKKERGKWKTRNF